MPDSPLVSEQPPEAVAQPDSTPAVQDAPAAAQPPAAPRKPRVLMLTHRLPYPPDRGDRIRSYHLLRLLSGHFDMALGAVSEDPVWLQHHQLLSTMAKRVFLQPISPGWSKVHGVRALLAGKAITPACHFRHGLAEQLVQWDEQAPFDAVLTFCTGMVDYPRMLQHARSQRPSAQSLPPLRHVLDLVDVDSEKWASYAKASYPPMKWIYGAEARRLRAIERGDFDTFGAVTVISEAEAQAYREHVGDHPGLTVVGNGVDLTYFQPLPQAEDPVMVFVGVLNYKPNSDSIFWFVKQVLPKVLEKSPGARLLVVGRHPTPAIEELGEKPGVQIVGSVPDVREYLERASVVIAPLRIARGVQNKVLEAMACARAVVCSPGAAEGIDATDGEHFHIADEPDKWADAITSLFADKARRQTMGDAARRQVESVYSWAQRLRPMINLLKAK